MQHWAPSVGDPTVTGWIITIAYFLASGLCMRARAAAKGEEARLWLWIAICFALFGFNKQLDLQTLLVQVVRGWARSSGWYGDRRTYQAIFIAVVALGGAAALWALAKRFRGSGGAVKCALLGLGCTVTFVVLRAASFHHMDRLLRLELSGFRAHALIEFTGIAVVAAAALLYRKSHGSMKA